MLTGLPDGPAGTGNGTVDTLRRGLGVFGRQREATILVVTVALLLYFGLTHPTTFVSRTNAVDLLSEIMAPIAIIADRRGAAADLRRDRPVGRFHLHPARRSSCST